MSIDQKIMDTLQQLAGRLEAIEAQRGIIAVSQPIATPAPAMAAPVAVPLTLYYFADRDPVTGLPSGHIEQIQWPALDPAGQPMKSADEVLAEVGFRIVNGRVHHTSRFLTNGKLSKNRQTGEYMVKPKIYMPHPDGKTQTMWYIDLAAGSSMTGRPISPNTWRAYTWKMEGGERVERYYAWEDRNHLYKEMGRAMDPTAPSTEPVIPAATQPPKSRSKKAPVAVLASAPPVAKPMFAVPVRRGK